MLHLLKRLTVDQWDAIDREHRVGEPVRAEVAAVLITAAVALVIPRYFGRWEALGGVTWLAEYLKHVPHPSLHPHVYWAGFKFINYGLLPAICIKLFLKRRIAEHGLSVRHDRRVWLLYLGMLLLVLPLAYLASKTDAFLNTYPKYREAGESWTQLVIWELAYGFQFLMLEFFFRGFLVFALARHIGSLAIFVMIVPYAMIHLGKPLAECLGSILAGIALGTIALRTRSIYGGVAVHCGVAWGMDLFALAQNGSLARLLAD